MNNIAKYIANGLVLLFIAFGITLWLTRGENWFRSQSAFANAENVIWYYLMHLSGVGVFVILGIFQKRKLDFLIAFGLLGILATNMYHFPFWHNLITVVTLCLTLLNILINSSYRTLKYNIILVVLAVFFFLTGYIDLIHFFLGEQMAEIMIGVWLLRRINIKATA